MNTFYNWMYHELRGWGVLALIFAVTFVLGFVSASFATAVAYLLIKLF